MPDAQTTTGLLSLDDYCDAIGCAKLLRLTLRQLLAGTPAQTFAEWEQSRLGAEQQAAQAFDQLARQRQGPTPAPAPQAVADIHVGNSPPPAPPAAKPRRRTVKTGGAPPPSAAG